ncbi:DUF2515 family protein [Pseudoduganella danionis]|uniref:DUF2515 family protein n=1 Tax=Pseudoduganella danionis TaxID=1890295 RepID=UPI00362067F4
MAQEAALSEHQQDAVPLHRNVTPIAECKVTSREVDGKHLRTVDVPILSCASVWLRCQKEAEEWIAPGGKLLTDPIARNRRINRAYAQLWLADHRFQWAGLAAFASKQVGCGLLHSAQKVTDAQQEIKQMATSHAYASNTELAYASAMPAGTSAGAGYMFRQLALGNLALFLDIYPLHRFFMLRGYQHLATCLEARRDIATQVIWPVDKEVLRFGKPFSEIKNGFEAVEHNRIADSVLQFAQHEQVNILQAVIYNDFAMRRALDANQFAWATGFPSGVAEAIELTLSARCHRDNVGPLTVAFSKKETLNCTIRNKG